MSSKEEKEEIPENENPVVTKLRTTLKEKGIDRATFLVANEEWRKRALGEDYTKIRSEAQWVYDQPISARKEEEETRTTSATTSTGTTSEYQTSKTRSR